MKRDIDPFAIVVCFIIGLLVGGFWWFVLLPLAGAAWEELS